MLAHGRWFSPCTPAYSATKIGRNDIAEILLKVASNTKIQSNQIVCKQETLRAKKWCFLWSIFILPPILMICYVKLNDDGQKPGCMGILVENTLSPHETHDVADELWLGYHVLSTLHRDRQIRLHDLRNNYKTTSSITRMTHRGYQPRYCPTHGQVAPQQRFTISNHTDHNYKLKSSSATLQILSDVTAESRMVIGQQPPFNNRWVKKIALNIRQWKTSVLIEQTRYVINSIMTFKFRISKINHSYPYNDGNMFGNERFIFDIWNGWVQMAIDIYNLYCDFIGHLFELKWH